MRNAESLAANYDLDMNTEAGSLLGAQLKRWRKSRGLTLEQVAADIETSKGHLSDMERGKRPINSRWLARIADVYGAQVSEIIGALPLPSDDVDAEIAESVDLLRQLQAAGKLEGAKSYLRFLAGESGNRPLPGGEPEDQDKSKVKVPR